MCLFFVPGIMRGVPRGLSQFVEIQTNFFILTPDFIITALKPAPFFVISNSPIITRIIRALLKKPFRRSICRPLVNQVCLAHHFIINNFCCLF